MSYLTPKHIEEREMTGFLSRHSFEGRCWSCVLPYSAKNTYYLITEEQKKMFDNYEPIAADAIMTCSCGAMSMKTVQFN